MDHPIIETNDGSHTLYSRAVKEHYHSTFGAIAEAKHIFVNKGFNAVEKDRLSIFEMGFGTGLNCFLTFIESLKKGKKVSYHAIEKYPVAYNIIEKINYPMLIDHNYKDVFYDLHKIKWDNPTLICKSFKLKKTQGDILTYDFTDYYDIIYYDAFSPVVQPELWEEKIFKAIYNHLHDHGFIITYSVKGIVKNKLKKCGFSLEKLAGPPNGKREILRALKK